MSAWGPGNFENDDAMDWVAELESYADDGPIIDALNTIIDQADDCPEEVETWVEGRPAPSSSMISNARYATEVVRDNSQLKDRWKESDDFEAWQASLGDLLARLLC